MIRNSSSKRLPCGACCRPTRSLQPMSLTIPRLRALPAISPCLRLADGRGWAGFAEERSETSLACRQVGPVTLKAKFTQGEEIYRQRRSLFFKKMQIVRGCDAKRNVLVYLAYTDKIIEGSPQNSTSTVPIMPWGTLPAPKCGEFLNE